MVEWTPTCFNHRFRVYHVKLAATVPSARGSAVSEVSNVKAVSTTAPDSAEIPPSQILGSIAGLHLELSGGHIIRLRLGAVAAELNVSMRWYNSSDGADGAIASGAYIFR